MLLVNMEKMMEKEIRKEMIVRLDVVDEDELMACSKGQRQSSMVGKSDFGTSSDL